MTTTDTQHPIITLQSVIDKNILERIQKQYDNTLHTHVEYRMKLTEPIDSAMLDMGHSVRSSIQDVFVSYSPVSKERREARVYVSLKGWDTTHIQKEIMEHLLEIFQPARIRAKVSYRSA